MVKELNGRELVGFIKERQAHLVQILRSNKKRAKLVIVRDSDNPVITKYVGLKCRYGEDIGVEVVDLKVEPTAEALKQAIQGANQDEMVSGIIVQLPLVNSEITEEVLSEIAPEKDVDGLSGKGAFDSATATAINWLLTGYNIDLKQKRIAIVGRGRLVGRPLASMWGISGLNVEVFHRGSDFSKLHDYEVIVTATGAPDLITDEMIRSGAVIVDAGTASEGGKLVGDISDEIRERTDISAITPKIGGVGPLTVGVLFENVLMAAERAK